jgi:hypothetical protein
LLRPISSGAVERSTNPAVGEAFGVDGIGKIESLAALASRGSAAVATIAGFCTNAHRKLSRPSKL